MRLKTYTSYSIQDAMKQIRAEMGEDAIIISTQSNPQTHHVSVTAAIEDDVSFIKDKSVPNDSAPEETQKEETSPLEFVESAIKFHGVSDQLLSTILHNYSLSSDDNKTLRLQETIQNIFSFNAVEDSFTDSSSLLMVGMPGAGKTVSTVKLAANAKRLLHAPRIVSTDFVKPVASDEMRRYISLLKLDLFTAKTPDEIVNIRTNSIVKKPMIIDSFGINPFDASSLQALKDFSEASNAEPILVLPAGGDVMESVDIARAFQTIGCKRLLGVKLDMSKRIGNLLEVSYQCDYQLCNFGYSRFVSEGFEKGSPQFVANKLLGSRET